MEGQDPSEKIHQFKHPQEQEIDQDALQRQDRFSFQYLPHFKKCFLTSFLLYIL